MNEGAIELGSAFATCRHSITSHALSLSLASIIIIVACPLYRSRSDMSLIASMLANERLSAELADLEARAPLLDTEVIGIIGASASTC